MDCSSSKVVGYSDSDQEGNEGDAADDNQKAAKKEPLSLDELIAKKAEAEARESKVMCCVHGLAKPAGFPCLLAS